MTEQSVLTRTLVELADTLVEDFDVVDLMCKLSDRCVEALSVRDAGVMLAAPIGGPLQLMASSSNTMRDLEVYELQTSDGPCLDAYHSGDPVLNADLSTSRLRWPRFTAAALAAGFDSVTAVPMRLRGNTIGALNLFSDDSGLEDDDLLAARAFADVATIAVLQHQVVVESHRLNEQLSYALNSRVVIEQAKGMLAERANVDVNEAFTIFRTYSRDHNKKLRDVAEAFIAGELPVHELQASVSRPAAPLPGA